MKKRLFLNECNLKKGLESTDKKSRALILE